MKLESRHEKEKSPHSLLSNTEKEKSPHLLLSNTLFLFYKHQHYVPWIVTGVKMVKQVKVWNWCKCIKMFWYAEIISVARAHTKFIAFDSISCHLHHFYIFGGFFQPFLVFFDVTDLPRKLEFYISDLTISVLVQINLPIQYI